MNIAYKSFIFRCDSFCCWIVTVCYPLCCCFSIFRMMILFFSFPLSISIIEQSIQSNFQIISNIVGLREYVSVTWLIPTYRISNISMPSQRLPTNNIEFFSRIFSPNKREKQHSNRMECGKSHVILHSLHTRKKSNTKSQKVTNLKRFAIINVVCVFVSLSCFNLFVTWVDRTNHFRVHINIYWYLVPSRCILHGIKSWVEKLCRACVDEYLLAASWCSFT